MVEGLVDSIDKMSSLTNLNLSYNPLADSGLKLLSNALPAMAHLSTLHLDFVKSGTVGAEALINALENRVNPMTLSFKRNYYSDAAFKQFQALNDGFIDIML